MKQRVLLLSHDLHLFEQLKKIATLDCVLCNNLQTLAAEVVNSRAHSVFVHLTTGILSGLSPAQFVSELENTLTHSVVFGLADEDTPARLQQLVEVTFDGCIELPLREGDIKDAVDRRFDLESDLERFWSRMPHQELHGRTRSLVTFTPAMFEMMDEIQVAARHKVTSLLIGETGCGKTFLARLIHELSAESEERFCTVACGALPPDLIESELFGSVQGAFTGADRDRDGKFAATGKGTLLLDEIDVLQPDQQAKLLRVIETGEYEQVGSNETQKFEGRMIVASNYDLEDLVRAGTFRTDLFYRLNILNFRLLPLRERPLDVEYLARKFALEHGRTHGIAIRGLEAGFLAALREYPWPGNIREMENVIRRAVLYCQRGVLSVNDLPSNIRRAVLRPAVDSFPNQPTAGHANIGIQPGMPVLSDHAGFHRHQGGSNGDNLGGWSAVDSANPNRLPPPANPGMVNGSANGGSHAPHNRPPRLAQANGGAWDESQSELAAVSVEPPKSLEARVDLVECQIIQDSLNRNNHRRKETAAELGISRVTLYNKMKKFGLM